MSKKESSLKIGEMQGDHVKCWKREVGSRGYDSSNLLHIEAPVYAKGDQVKRLLIMDIVARMGRGGMI